ncbi:hypothetical protein J1N35_004669 [Gossypium stocksii]|uniref:Uncharacterized protein n=1 Tax=Gossypium stocksii TaxID=47602 RepID=A0A9D3WCD1_9ROSI|nr:hypothetical protein J1N35_004669 [Gossypium stocksii]
MVDNQPSSFEISVQKQPLALTNQVSIDHYNVGERGLSLLISVTYNPQRTPSAPLIVLNSHLPSSAGACVAFLSVVVITKAACYHRGLTKGFLQSLLAFCPPPIMETKNPFLFAL